MIADGELSRFDLNHPQTNDMIEYFVAPMENISTRLSREELSNFKSRSGMSFRSQPAGVVRGPVGEGTLNLPAAWSFVKNLTHKPLKFTLTSSYMLAKTLVDEQITKLSVLKESPAVLNRSLRYLELSG